METTLPPGPDNPTHRLAAQAHSRPNQHPGRSESTGADALRRLRWLAEGSEEGYSLAWVLGSFCARSVRVLANPEAQTHPEKFQSAGGNSKNIQTKQVSSFQDKEKM